jgi:hypothetical protein
VSDFSILPELISPYSMGYSLRHLLSFLPLLLQAVFFDFSEKLIKVYSITGDRWVISTFSFPLFGRRPIGPLARRAKRGEGRFYKS